MRLRWSTVMVVVVCFAAFASALGGIRVGVPRLDDWRKDYGGLPPPLREDPVALLLGFDADSWEALRHELGKGDRYAVVARGPTRFEVRNYAAYALLPAVQVTLEEDPDVVVYYGASPPGRRCTRIGSEACISRRKGA